MSPEEISTECARRLGWILEVYYSGGKPTGYGRLPTEPYGTINPVPNFHGSVDAAMSLVSKAREWGWGLEVNYARHTSWGFLVFFQQRINDVFTSHQGFAPTLSAAICAAFLQLPQPSDPTTQP